MGFSTETNDYVRELAERAKESYAFGASPPKGVDFITIFTMILGVIQTLCKPKTAESRQALIKKWAKVFAINGYEGCIDCLPEKAQKKINRKLTKMKVKNSLDRDKLVYTAVVTANHNHEDAIGGMTSAFEKDEVDDEDD